MPGTRVYIGGLPQGVRERDIEKFLRGYGRVRDILLKNGFGFVEFDDPRDAEDACYELNGKDLLGERVTLESARGPSRRYDDYRGSVGYGRGRRSTRFGPPTRTEHRVLIENLSSRVSWQDLKDYMRQAGEVTYADAHKDRRGEGIVEFARYSDMRNAIDRLDDTELNGRRIRVIDDTRNARRRSHSRSRSRHRTRSRTRSRSRSRSRNRSRSRSHSKDRRSGSKDRRSGSKDRRSGSKDRRSGSKERRSGSKERDEKSRSRSRSKERGASGDRAKSASRDRSKSRENDGDRKSRSKSKSKSRSRSRSGSRGAGDRSRSRSPRANGDRSGDDD